jgi:hypothetical protein
MRLVKFKSAKQAEDVFINPEQVLGVGVAEDTGVVMVFLSGGSGGEDALYFTVEGTLEDVVDALLRG